MRSAEENAGCKKGNCEEKKTRNNAFCFKRSQALIYYQYFSLSTTLRIFYRSTFFTDPKFRHSSFSALCIPPCPPYPMQFENHLDDAIKTLLKLLVLK